MIVKYKLKLLWKICKESGKGLLNNLKNRNKLSDSSPNSISYCTKMLDKLYSNQLSISNIIPPKIAKNILAPYSISSKE